MPGPNLHRRFFSHAGGPITHNARPGLASLLDGLGPALIATDVQAGAKGVDEGTIVIIAADENEGTEYRTANVEHVRLPRARR